MLNHLHQEPAFMKDPGVVKALQAKQDSMLQESGEHLARTLPLSRADVMDRLWQLAQLSPEQTNCNITGQVKAAQALEQIFALNIDRVEVLRRELQGKSEAEVEFYVVHGFLPIRNIKSHKSLPRYHPLKRRSYPHPPQQTNHRQLNRLKKEEAPTSPAVLNPRHLCPSRGRAY